MVLQPVQPVPELLDVEVYLLVPLGGPLGGQPRHARLGLVQQEEQLDLLPGGGQWSRRRGGQRLRRGLVRGVHGRRRRGQGRQGRKWRQQAWSLAVTLAWRKYGKAPAPAREAFLSNVFNHE